MKNMSFKVVIGNALPCLPKALHHGNPITVGYARVSMDDIVPGFEDLEIDIPTPEGDMKLRDVKRYIILWQKKYIKFLGSARPPTPRNPSPPSLGDHCPPTLALVHLKHRISQHRPLVHLRRICRRCPQCTSGVSGEAAPQYYSAGEKKQSRAAKVSTTDKVVHRTTKVPGPSLKPLP
jgi:hypothetical protein